MLYHISSMFFTVQLVLEQKSGNLPISCLSSPFCVVSVEIRHCLHGPKGVRLEFSLGTLSTDDEWDDDDK